MFLSFIVPVYNGEKYISECLDSLLDQDIECNEYEIICINDGSKDHSEEIIRQYCLSHANIKLLNKENGGVSSARNYGLDQASGDWIWFVDADDLVQSNSLGKLKKLTYGVDCVRFHIYCFNNRLSAEEQSKKEQKAIVSNNPGGGILCNIYKKEVLDRYNIQFDVGVEYGEDIIWLCKMAEHVHDVANLDEVCYFYRQHSESVTHLDTSAAALRRLKSYIKASSILKEMYESEEVKSSVTADNVMFFLRLAMLEIAKMPDKKNRSYYLKDMRNKSLFPFAPLKESKMKKTYVTQRSDTIGRVFNSLVVNSTTVPGYYILVLWYKMYNSYMGLKSKNNR